MGEVFVEGFGVSVSKKSERLIVKKKGEVIFERPFFEVERVIVSTEGATVSAAAIHECIKHGIPVGFRLTNSKRTLSVRVLASSLLPRSVRLMFWMTRGR